MVPELGYMPRGRSGRNVLVLVAYVLFLVIVVIVYAEVFQYLMAKYESQPDHSFINGIYWTITTMTTLGFGDITFVSHAGRLFSAFVTLTGFIFLLVFLPFGIISVVFAPWLENLLRYRPRMRLKRSVKGHVVICGWDTVTEALTRSLTATGIPYVVLTGDVDEARDLEEAGVSTVMGRRTDAEALKRVRTETARVVIANMNDPDNTNLVLTVASFCSTPVAAVVTLPERTELVRIAGAAHVVPLRETLGNYLAVRATTRGAKGHVVDSLGDLLFAEIPSHGTPFIGLSLRETAIRQRTGVSVIGIWERGRFSLPEPKTVITDGMVMLLVGTEADLEALEGVLGGHHTDDFVMILGYGTVGSAAAAFLRRRQVPHVIVDRNAPADADEPNVIQGDAGKQSVLEQAGIQRAGGLIVTTNDDGTNVFLTLAGRHLNPHIRIVSRANREENVAELYAAGADFVVSRSSIGASILTNIIEGRQNVFLSEGVRIFWREVPAVLHGQTLAGSNLRSLTGATAVAIQRGRDKIDVDLAPDTVLDSETALILVGTPQSEELFSERFGKRGKANKER
jgi:voltage-gated potassium channel